MVDPKCEEYFVLYIVGAEIPRGQNFSKKLESFEIIFPKKIK
jgi:hypothetical protein